MSQEEQRTRDVEWVEPLDDPAALNRDECTPPDVHVWIDDASKCVCGERWRARGDTR